MEKKMQASEAFDPTDLQRRDLSGKYLSFFLGEEEYGLEILSVQEIIGMIPITPVPRMPDYIRGVINLRGKVIPVIDLRLKFAMSSMEDTSQTCIIVVQSQGREVGVVVDKVSEVLDISCDEIEDPPAMGSDVRTDYILGIGKSQDKVRMLLDIEKALASSGDALPERPQPESQEQKDEDPGLDEVFESIAEQVA